MSLNFGFSLPALAAYGGGGDNPFGQLGPTLDLSFANTVTDVSSPTSYTLDTNFITPQYQIATQYAIWETNTGLVAKNFGDIITFTRASTGSYFDATGTLQSAAINSPRFDHNPSTLAPLGFLIEEQRTNSIRNNTMQGAVAGTPGTLPTNWSTFTTLTGLTRTVVGTGTENGIAYVDIRLNGTPSAAGIYGIYFEGATQVAAANGQNWTSFAYTKLAGGSLTGISTVNCIVAELNNVGGFLASSTTAATPTGSALSTQRTVVSRTFNQATTAFALPYIDLVLSGAAIDITLRIGLPQLEQGAFATSVIPTTTTALTRSADVARVNTLSPWFNATASTIYGEWTPIASALGSGVSQIVTRIGDGTGNNFIALFQLAGSANKASQNMLSGGANPGRLDSGGAYSTATVKAAAAFAASDRAISANGAVATTSATGALPLTSTRMSLGVDDSLSVGFLNGYLRRITYYPRRLSNADLQTITT